MSILLDTNILRRLSQIAHPHFSAAKSAVAALAKNHKLNIVPQNMYEFWAVATRPVESANGLGLLVSQAKSEINRIRGLFTLLPESSEVFQEWLKLVEYHDVKGKASHDARLVAAMHVHGLRKILTFNETDFSRYENVEALNPLTSIA